MTEYTNPLPGDIPIYPGPVGRAAYAAAGAAACMVRLATAPVRRYRPEQRTAVFLESFGMGDAIALQPLVTAYLEEGFRVVLAVRAEWAEIFPEHSLLVKVPLGKSCSKKGGFARSLYGVSGASAALRPYSRGALGIDVRGDVRAVAALYLAGCGRVETLTRYYTANDCPVMPGAAVRRPIIRGVSRRVLNGVFLPAGSPELKRASLEHLLPEGGVSVQSGRVAIVPLSGWKGKDWLPERWEETVCGLSVCGFSPIVLCGPGQMQDAVRATGGKAAVRECRSVREWVCELAACGAAVTVNTGPMHVAAALGCAVVLIEGTSRLPLWAPEAECSVVVHHQNAAGCAPCHQNDSNLAYAATCMAGVTAREVLRAFDIVAAKKGLK